jgi:hypothetical protein
LEQRLLQRVGEAKGWMVVLPLLNEKDQRKADESRQHHSEEARHWSGTDINRRVE